jgi:hypothetical protein
MGTNLQIHTLSIGPACHTFTHEGLEYLVLYQLGSRGRGLKYIWSNKKDLFGFLYLDERDKKDWFLL